MWAGLCEAINRHGTQAFSFFPATFVLPDDIELLHVAMDEPCDRLYVLDRVLSKQGGGGGDCHHSSSSLAVVIVSVHDLFCSGGLPSRSTRHAAAALR